MVLLLYAGIATGLLAPMASDTILPKEPDHANHVAAIVQARQGIEEGQFPLRVAPWQHQGWRYPQFQFYSPVPYEIAGRVYRWLRPENPFAAYQAMLWAALLSGGFWMYLTSHFLTRNIVAALLAGVVYMSAPYLLVNVHARGAFTEVIAQGLLPAVLYCSARTFFSASGWRSSWLPAAGIAWGLLALTHTITWFCGGAFMGLFFVGLGVDRTRWRIAPGLWRVGAGFAIGCVLAMYVLVPMMTSDYLVIRTMIGNVAMTTWITPLATLLSPTSLPPEPQPGQMIAPHLNPSIGWPMLLGVAILIDAAWRLGGRRHTGDDSDANADAQPLPTARIASALVALFLLAVMLTWGPFDMWLLAPDVVHLPQYSYRFLSQAGWTGALIFAFAMVSLFGRELSARHAAVGILLIVLAHSSFLPQLESAKVEVAQIRDHPDLGYGHSTYLVKTQRLPQDRAVADTLKVPITYEPARTIGVVETEKACQHLGDALSCHVIVPAGDSRFIQLPQLFYPSLLDVRVNGHVAPYLPIAHGEYLLASVQLQPGTYDIYARFQGVSWANITSAVTWLVTLAGLAALTLTTARRR